MGTNPETPNYEPGNKCVYCWEILFNDITPKYVEADISGIEKCIPAFPDPPNGTFLLEQQVNACQWRYAVGPIIMTWELRVDESRFIILAAGAIWFNSIVGDTCIDAFVNQNVCGVGPTLGENGYALCYWGPTIGP